jgi:uncharacterized DUF497 family protein
LGITYDPDKNERNIRERDISFESAREFEWASAYIVEDMRKNYPERRFQALGYIGTRLHMLVFTPRAEDTHVISLRKANRREVKRYGKQAKK